MDKEGTLLRMTLDLVLFGLHNNELCFLTIKRKEPPFDNEWSLPATHIDPKVDVDLEHAANRLLKNLTGLDAPYLEQVQTLGNKHRDPRGWAVTVVYYSFISCQHIHLLENNPKFCLTPVKANLKNLAFDHAHIVESCLQRLQNKSLYTSLPIFLLEEEFTLTDLQKIYETILGFKMEKKSFRRRLLDAGFLRETGNIRRANHRPAQLYRLSQKHPYFFARIIEGAREGKNVE
jgi:ADP-ribose pyrophosphatase YjhB (NUDIX family)